MLLKFDRFGHLELCSAGVYSLETKEKQTERNRAGPSWISPIETLFVAKPFRKYFATGVYSPMVMPEKTVFAGYIGKGVSPEKSSAGKLSIYTPNTGFEGNITFIQRVTNIFK